MAPCRKRSCWLKKKKKDPFLSQLNLQANTLPSSVSRGGVLLVLRRVRDPERRCLRRMRTGEWLGSLFHLSRLSKERLRNTGRLPRPLERDLRLRSVDRDLERRLLSPDLDLFLRPVERLLDRLPLSGDLDLLLPRVFGERDRLFRAGERDLDLWALCRDLDLDRLRRAERDRRRRTGLRDFERLFFFSGETESFLLTGVLDLRKGRFTRLKCTCGASIYRQQQLHTWTVPSPMISAGMKWTVTVSHHLLVTGL